MKNNKHIGSSFDDFLHEEGLLAETEATAVKRVIAYQIEKEMEERFDPSVRRDNFVEG